MNITNEKKVQINKRQKKFCREDLAKLSKEELINKLIQLESYNVQLKNILQKKLSENEKFDGERIELMEDTTSTSIKNQVNNHKSETKRKFNFQSAHKRHVLLKFLYFGWDYHGFASQEDSNATIEYHLFKALTRTCLIESRATSNYHRCGRTDKEVSAFCQVISINLRSKFPTETQNLEEFLASEIDYCGILNRVLPNNIQCIAWMPLRNPLYSARFDCTSRTYRYFFPKGNLNIESMREACRLLKRHADFRNFCKMDVHNGVTNYMRNVQSATIELCPNEEIDDIGGYTMYYLEIRANAFLWHQIRCIMAVLILIGQDMEKANVINELFDVEKNPCKPQYTPAIGLPLNLFNCDFREKSCQDKYQGDMKIDDADMENINTNENETRDTDATNWIYDEQNLQKLIENVQSEWAHFNIKSCMIRNVLHHLEKTLANEFHPQGEIKSQVNILQETVKSRQYQSLMTRKRCESLENRIEHFVKKQRIIITDDNFTKD